MKNLIFKLLFSFLTFCISFNSFSQNCVGTAGQVKWNYWLNFNFSPDSTDLSALENFPSRPDGFQILGQLKSNANFSENFAAMIRGYIYVPANETYEFNITGDDRVLFYLSTNDSPTNKRKRAETTTWTNVTEHTKQASQTSIPIALSAGQNYYFEIYNFEGGGGDHVTLYWRKYNSGDLTWRVVGYENIKDYVCGQSCPPRGTACNDGNASTTNDQQDGFCNCVGTMPTANACVGEKGVVEAYYYDNITGSYVEPDLINAPRFPLQPHRKENLLGAYGPLYSAYSKENYGTLVQGFLTVPVTGQYEFNLTGDNQTFFFLSKNDSIQYKQTHQIIVFSGLDETEHNNSSFQNTSPILLEKGKYYYFEFRNKENTWRDHFNLYWKTPFHEIRSWKRVPSFYLFDYKCEISCIPAGTLCNDGNPQTNNDQYDNACNCVGTPCTAPNCTDIVGNYTPYDACAPTQNLVSGADNSWVSCNSTAANPNSARSGLTNWIKYDFGDIYKMQGTRVWNYNVQSATDRGFKNVYVDYSEDGNTWTQLGGSYLWSQAPGTNDYSGFTGPNFNDQKARYVLISAIDNWGAGCSGFSKISFDAQLCNPNGTACDDNDPLTFHDKFDANCNCAGVKINCEPNLTLGRVTLSETAYKAKLQLNAESLVPATKNISFTAGNNIVLMPGFEVNQNAVFSAKIEDCLQASFAENEKNTHIQEVKNDSTATGFSTKNVESNNVKRIIFKLNKPGQVKLLLKDAKGNLVATIIDDYYQNLGTQIKFLPTGKLSKGEYWIELEVNETILKEKIIVE